MKIIINKWPTEQYVSGIFSGVMVTNGLRSCQKECNRKKKKKKETAIYPKVAQS